MTGATSGSKARNGNTSIRTNAGFSHPRRLLCASQDSHTQLPVLPSLTSEEQPQQTCRPERKRNWVYHQHLLQKKLERIEFDIPAALVDVVHQLHERPVVTHVPKKIGQEDEEGDQAADPDPLMRQRLSLRG